jgi:cell division protein FtsB
MWRKIKQFLNFLRLALRGGWRGLIGFLFLIICCYSAWNILTSRNGIINLIKYNRQLSNLNQLIEQKTALRDNKQTHINLIKSYSPDYIQELIQNNLNMAPQKTKLLKI